MYKLALSLMSNRKVFISVLIVIITFTSACFTSVNFICTAVLDQKVNVAHENYGTFTCTVNELSNEQLGLLKNEVWENNIGYYELFDNIEKENSVMTIGYANSNFIKLANIDFISGSMPTKNDEIIVEKFVADLLECQNSVGRQIELNINGQKQKVILKGIIENYSFKLSVNLEAIKGINNYPNIICAENSILNAKTSYKSAIINLPDIYDSMGNSSTELYEFINKIGLNDEQLTQNYNFYTKGLLNYDYLCKLKLIFSALILVFSLGGVLCLIIFYYKDYSKKLAVFEVLGLNRNKLIKIIVIQLAIILGISFVCSLFLAWSCGLFLFNTLFVNNSFQYNLFSSIILPILIWFVLLYALITLLLINLFTEIKANSIYSNLQSNYFKSSNTKINKSKKTNPLNKLRKLKISYTVIYSAIFIILCISSYLNSMMLYSYEGPDYFLSSKEMPSFEIVNSYEIESVSKNYIPFNDVFKLKPFEDNIFIDNIPSNNSASLLIPKVDIPSYFTDWNNTFRSPDTSYDKSIILENWPKEADEYEYISNVNFILADNKTYQKIKETYNLSADIKELKKVHSAILFCPQNENSQCNVYNDENIFIGGIIQTKDDVSFVKEEYSVASVIPKQYNIDFDKYNQNREGITVVLNENIAEKSKIFRGYNNVQIYLKDNISNAQSMEVKNIIENIASKVQGGLYSSKFDEAQKDNIYRNYVLILTIFSSVLVFSSSCIAIVLILYHLLIYKKKEYGILKSLGLSNNTLKQSFILSDIKSLMLSYLLSAIYLYLYVGNIEYFMMHIGYFVLSMIVPIILVLFKSHIVSSYFKSKSISNLINEQGEC